MEELIRKSDVVKVIDKKIQNTSDYLQHDVLIELGEDVEELHLVDAVQVVRCKNCKHWHEETGWCNWHSHFIDGDGEFCHPWESSNWKMFDENDFCSDGEMRTSAE